MSEPIKTNSAAAIGAMIEHDGDSVRQIRVPPTAQALSTLSHIDYADAFLIEARAARQWPAVRFVRTVLAEAPVAVRTRLQLGWATLGLKPVIGGSSRSILGWEVRVSTPEFVLLGRDSLIGMPGELLFKREHDALLFCTFVQHNNCAARALWASVQAPHVEVVRDVLEQAARRFAQ